MPSRPYLRVLRARVRVARRGVARRGDAWRGVKYVLCCGDELLLHRLYASYHLCVGRYLDVRACYRARGRWSSLGGKLRRALGQPPAYTRNRSFYDEWLSQKARAVLTLFNKKEKSPFENRTRFEALHALHALRVASVCVCVACVRCVICTRYTRAVAVP